MSMSTPLLPLMTALSTWLYHSSWPFRESQRELLLGRLPESRIHPDRWIHYVSRTLSQSASCPRRPFRTKQPGDCSLLARSRKAHCEAKPKWLHGRRNEGSIGVA